MIAGLIKAKRNYNPSLVSTGEGFLLAYRSEPEDFKVSEIVLAEMDSARKVLRNQRLKVPGAPAGCSFEDPRLLMYDDCPYIAFSMAKYGAKDGWKCVQAYGRLIKKAKTWTLAEVWVPKYGANDWGSKEKNWTFFEAEGALRCIYDMGAAGWTVLELDGDEVLQEWRHPPLRWRWGRMSGGTPAVDWQGQKLTMFHSWEKHPRRHRLYHAAWVAFSATAPHAPTLVSAAPVLTAQDDWGTPECESGWQPLCVFPGGLQLIGQKALVAYGRNDFDCAIDAIRVEQMRRVSPAVSARGEVRIRLTGDVMINGQPAWAGTEAAVLAADAASLIERGKAVPL
jgi:predicted GH43/DUF377 family glycosyl hydrolase